MFQEGITAATRKIIQEQHHKHDAFFSTSTETHLLSKSPTDGPTKRERQSAH